MPRAQLQCQTTADLNSLGDFAFMQFIEGAFRFFEEEEAEKSDDQTSYTKDLEEGAVGGSDHLGSWFSATAHPHR